MKRSTLTLSILTALLVSACGGSSSNDEQTKDPTPPKVTPANPSTPSTGRTPTTGNKDNAGTSAGSSAGTSAGSSASSSSSDPTPPISSGSAPSGGKPIVITSEPKKEITPKPEDPEKDKEKENEKNDPQGDALAKAIKEAEANVEALRIDADYKMADIEDQIKDKEKRQEAARKKLLINDLELQGSNVDIEAIARAIEKKKDNQNYSTWKGWFENYKNLRTEWLKAEEKRPQLQQAAEEAQQKYIDEKKNLADLKAKAALENAEIAVDKELAAAMQKEADLEFVKDQKALEAIKANWKTKEIAREEKNLTKEVADLTKAITLEEDQGKKDALQKRLEAATKKQTQLGGQKTLATQTKKEADLAKKNAETNATAAKTKADGLREIAQNRGLAGGEGLSANKDFKALNIQKAVHDTSGTKNEWILTLVDGKKITINTKVSDPVEITSGGTNYGSFKKEDGKDVIAFKKAQDSNEQSIYGYVGEKFYSVGSATPAAVVTEMKAPRVTYKGTALLQAAKDKGAGGLVATFEGDFDFNARKVTGGFSKFATYDRNSATAATATALDKDATANPQLKEALKNDSVRFDASIEPNSNKFIGQATEAGKASVYGYFYGQKAEEVGGLVELKDVFHGSFGGALTK